MKISMNSWHYRWLAEMGLRPYARNNVCAYVRGLALAAIISLALLSAASLVLFTMGTFVADMFVELGKDLEFAAIIGGILWVVASVMSLFRGLELLATRRYERKKAAYLANHTLEEWYNHLYEEKEDGLFKRWWKDKSSKMCSFIQFT